MGRCQEIDGIV